MNLSRLFQPLLFAFVLLFAQHAGAVHTLHHAVEDLMQHHEDKQAPHSETCEKCADYAQLNSALSGGTPNFTPLPVLDVTVQHRTTSLLSIHTLAACRA
jgi:hypothetical protein